MERSPQVTGIRGADLTARTLGGPAGESQAGQSLTTVCSTVNATKVLLMHSLILNCNNPALDSR